MPNYMYNTIAIKGRKSDVLEFINRAIDNSAQFRKDYGETDTTIPTRQDNVDAAFDVLDRYGCSIISNFDYNSETEHAPILNKNIRLSTFRPEPETFLRFDTTNHPERFPEAAKEQKEKYGAIGWYDFNSDVWFGTKWNAEINDLELETYEAHDTAVLKFNTDTAWSQPYLWLEYLHNEFPNLHICFCSQEESGMYYGYGEVGGDEVDFAAEVEETMNKVKEEDFESEDDYYDARYEAELDAIDSMRGDFLTFVEEL